MTTESQQVQTPFRQKRGIFQEQNRFMDTGNSACPGWSFGEARGISRHIVDKQMGSLTVSCWSGDIGEFHPFLDDHDVNSSGCSTGLTLVYDAIMNISVSVSHYR